MISIIANLIDFIGNLFTALVSSDDKRKNNQE